MIYEKKTSLFNYRVLGVFIIVLLYRFFESRHEDELLKKSDETTAILTLIRDGKSVRDSASGKYKYIVKGKSYVYEENRNFNDLQIGDTILIEYAIEDPSVAKVVDKYYMKKYQRLKN